MQPSSSSEQTWRKIDRFLKDRSLIPIMGPGVVTFGDDDQLLYPWLVAGIAERLGIQPPPSSLHHLVCSHLDARGQIKDVSFELYDLLASAAPAPGRLLQRLASIPQCRHFFTLGFDPLLETALNAVRRSARPSTVVWDFASSTPTDLPASDPASTILGYLFGKVSEVPSFHIWDADAVEFVWKLHSQLPSLHRLATTFRENNLLFIGTNCSDWFVRFLLRTIRQRPLDDRTARNLLIADSASAAEDDTVMFYDSLSGNISVLPVDPVAFAHEFCDHALALEPPLVPGKISGIDLPVPAMEQTMPDGSLFVSYAHTDAAAAFRVVERLRAHGCTVWLDDDRLTCGDHFENNLEDAVKHHCGFFLSLISLTTESRSESYFHKERKWAAERSLSIHHSRPFYFPVVIDDAPTPLHHEPREFVKIDFERAPGGEISEAFAVRLATLQQALYPR